METYLTDQLKALAGEDQVLLQEPMSRHTTFRIGGPADIFISIQQEKELQEILKLLRGTGTDYFILGKGSNLLVSDAGYRGAVVQICRGMNEIQAGGRTIRAKAGALLSAIAGAARDASLTGFEFAGGIPGTLGGAVVMNAGAYGGEMKDVLSEVTVLTPLGEKRILKADELELGYRTSIVKEKDYIVLEAELSLQPGEKEKIMASMQELKNKRTEKQPLEYPSAGSTFKRPEGYFAGKLIQDAGLRGYRVGDAQVSEKHCGFVINRGNATAEQVTRLILDVRERVFSLYGVVLEPEVKFLGEFQEEICAL